MNAVVAACILKVSEFANFINTYGSYVFLYLLLPSQANIQYGGAQPNRSLAGDHAHSANNFCSPRFRSSVNSVAFRNFSNNNPLLFSAPVWPTP